MQIHKNVIIYYYIRRTTHSLLYSRLSATPIFPLSATFQHFDTCYTGDEEV